MRKSVTTGCRATVVEASAVSSPALTVSVCWPSVPKVTVAVARPRPNDTESGSVAAGSLLVSVSSPLKFGTSRPLASRAMIVTRVGESACVD